MNDSDKWREIYNEWLEVKRVKRLNQELYDLLFGGIHYLNQYSHKNNIPIKNRDRLVRISECIHSLMEAIEPESSDDNLQSDL